MHDWKTIAPLMFPIASVSFRWRIQMTLLNFSEAQSRAARRSGRERGADREEMGDSLDLLHEEVCAEDDRDECDDNWSATRGCAGVQLALEMQRR